MENRIKEMVCAIFRKYGMDKGIDNTRRMERVISYCLMDIEYHARIDKLINADENELRAYVMQSILYCVKPWTEN
jgi:hypothetical protein